MGIKNIFRAPYKSRFYHLTLTIFLKIKLEKKEAEPEKNRFIFVPGLRLVKNDPLPATAVENTYVSRNKTRLTASPSCLAKSAFPPESCKDNFKKTPFAHKKGAQKRLCLPRVFKSQS